MYTTEEQSSVVRFFLWAKGHVWDIHNEIFPVYDWKCLSRKAVHDSAEKRGSSLADDEDVETEVRKWIR
jgi:hypothetical protein